ncbi:beta-galactosidase [Enterococcus raffinosus]|uniref:beta-galactosidase n=1 Tax=Enterococcus raffinosus TaxID=71452 RepID=UPI001C0FE7ED|nr:beta-galactosidase [Enterococcus raffinosus]MBU5359580.1 beta-galactosidase [Enterococcus raffinosus]
MTNYLKEPRLLHGGDYNPDQWLDYPDILAKDLELMKESHTNTFSLGIFAWSALEPTEGDFHFEWLDKIMDDLHQQGCRIILATPSGARPAWMSQKYPEVLRTNAARQKMLHGGRHNHCFSSPIYREKVAIINKKLAERYGEHPALLMWHISNEYGGDCHCEYCQENFRSWLQKKYGNLKALNDAWWGSFWSHAFSEWSQIASPSPLGETAVHGMNLDWRRFVTDQTIDFFEHEISDIRKLTPDIPITTNFMADTMDLIPFQALDYEKFAKHVDILSWDCYPAWHNDWELTDDLASKVGFIDDLYRSLKQQPFLIMESTPSGVNWHPVNKTKRPGVHLLSSMQHIAHGSDSNLYFQWRKSRGSSEKFHGAVVNHDNTSDNRVFQEVREVGNAMEKIQAVKGSYKDAKVAILYDWDNSWALDDAQGFAQKTKRYSQTCQEHYRYFWNHDIPVEVVTPNANLSKYDLVVAPMLYLITEKSIQYLSDYVQAGGHLVSTYMTGIVNENDLVYLNGWPDKLQEIFGIEIEETDTYYPSDKNTLVFDNRSFTVKDYASLIKRGNARALAYYQEDFYAGRAAITVNHYGKGEAYFIAPRTDADFLEAFYQELVSKYDLSNSFVLVGDPSVSVQSRDRNGQPTFFVMNFSETTKTIQVRNETVDLLTDKPIGKEIHLSPYEVLVLEVK